MAYDPPLLSEQTYDLDIRSSGSGVAGSSCYIYGGTLNFIRPSLQGLLAVAKLIVTAGARNPTSFTVELISGTLPKGTSLRQGAIPMANAGTASSTDGNILTGAFDTDGTFYDGLHEVRIRATDTVSGDQADVLWWWMYSQHDTRPFIVSHELPRVIQKGVPVDSRQDAADLGYVLTTYGLGETQGQISGTAFEERWLAGYLASFGTSADDPRLANTPARTLTSPVTVSLISGILPPGLEIPADPYRNPASLSKNPPRYSRRNADGSLTASRTAGRRLAPGNAQIIELLRGTPTQEGFFTAMIFRLTGANGNTVDAQIMGIQVGEAMARVFPPYVHLSVTRAISS